LVVFEDDDTLAFLPQRLEAKGHCLVIPKEHVVNIFDIPDEVLGKVMVAAKRVAGMVREKLGAAGVNILHASGKEAQQSVFHFHVHVIPRWEDDGIDAWMKHHPDVTHEREEVYRQLMR